ncbi:MAG: dihydrolipoamide acetyltransferase family protein, partial [Solirubrobacteraceae bacterium]
MEEGTILKWLKSDGDEVARGEELVEIETDKATMTYESDSAGTPEIVAGEGDTLPLGEVIARVGSGSGAGAAERTAEGAGEEEGEEAGEEEDVPASAPTGDGGEPEDAPSPAAHGDGDEPEDASAPPPEDGGGGRVKASPVARRIARELSVDLASLRGSGPGRRIVKADVEAAASGDGAPARDRPPEVEREERNDVPSPVASEEDRGSPKGEVTIQELTRTQQLIARRMAESKATVPHFALDIEIDMVEAVSLRARLKDLAGDDPAPSLNDFVVKACALALRGLPRANGSYKDGRFELHSRVNVGVAVAVEDGLVVPTVFDADRKSLSEIARETRALAERVRAKAITPPELAGGTFTVSNLGMLGITSFTAVINPPQAAILAVGAVEPRVVVRDERILSRHRMAVTLACDHRILYGADAAKFLGRVRDLLEQPLGLAL